MAKNLIAFYSRADENYVSGMLKNLTIGNTEVAAGILQQLTGADLFKIEQVQPQKDIISASHRPKKTRNGMRVRN